MNEMRLEMRTGIALQIHVEIYKFFICTHTHTHTHTHIYIYIYIFRYPPSG